jgi:hypothetical protein
MRAARTLGELSLREVQPAAALADMGRDPVSVAHPGPMSSNDSNDDDPEHQVVLTVVQDHTETIIVADILAAAIDESFIRVVEFGRAGRSPDRAVAIYWAGFSGNAVRTVSGQLLCSADERSCLVTLVDTPSCSELASSTELPASTDRSGDGKGSPRWPIRVLRLLNASTAMQKPIRL